MKPKPKPKKPKRPALTPPCWQCELDIGHICFHGIPNAKWGFPG